MGYRGPGSRVGPSGVTAMSWTINGVARESTAKTVLMTNEARTQESSAAPYLRVHAAVEPGDAKYPTRERRGVSCKPAIYTMSGPCAEDVDCQSRQDPRNPEEGDRCHAGLLVGCAQDKRGMRTTDALGMH